jgi:hypothetical protein
MLLCSQLPEAFEQGAVRDFGDRMGGKAQKEENNEGWNQRDWF